jgi:protein TonB
VQAAPAGSSDYGWIADALWKRIEQLKRYPHLARINRLEGKVVLRAVIKADGQLVDLEVAKSSGHSVLDHDALEVLRRASPLDMTRPLGKPQMVVQIPISYQLDR